MKIIAFGDIINKLIQFLPYSLYSAAFLSSLLYKDMRGMYIFFGGFLNEIFGLTIGSWLSNGIFKIMGSTIPEIQLPNHPSSYCNPFYIEQNHSMYESSDIIMQGISYLITFYLLGKENQLNLTSIMTLIILVISIVIVRVNSLKCHNFTSILIAILLGGMFAWLYYFAIEDKYKETIGLLTPEESLICEDIKVHDE